MKKPAQADIERWSDDVARDRRSLAFLPLARAYRRQGLREAALQLCLRGLEAYPEHVEAHAVLAGLYLDSGELQKAADEWSFVLRLDPDNFEALRGMGFWCFERDQLSRARQLLERASAQRPDDAAVREALHVLGTREQLARPPARNAAAASASAGPASYAATPAVDAGVTSGAAAARADASVPAGATSRASASVASGAPAAAAAVAGPEPWASTPAAPSTPTAAAGAGRAFELVSATRAVQEPTRLFEELLAAGPLLGALLVDAQGLVLGGRLVATMAADADTLGAVLADAMSEAARTATHLELGSWRGVLVEAEHALLHITPVAGGNALVIAAARDTPTGWLLRAAAQAAEQANRYVREYA